CSPMRGSAMFTSVPSRNTIAEPSTAAIRVPRCDLVIRESLSTEPARAPLTDPEPARAGLAQSGWAFRKQSEQYTGRSMRGRNGTWAWLPHSEQRTAKYSRVGALRAETRGPPRSEAE